MHPAAIAWDIEHGLRNRNGTTNRLIQKNIAEPPDTASRPCDWCGEPVGINGKFIHAVCIQLERSHLPVGVFKTSYRETDFNPYGD